MEDSPVSKVHPVVLFTILNSYERRENEKDFVIGTLLGYYNADRVEITNAYVVPHNFSDGKISINSEANIQIYRLEKKVNDSIKMVGWFSVGHDITDALLLIQREYESKIKNPSFLFVKTDLSEDQKFDFKVYQMKKIGIMNRTQGNVLLPIGMHLEGYFAEKTSIDIMASNVMKSKKNRNQIQKAQGDFDHLIELTETLETMLDKVKKYVDDVVEGKITMDNKIGKKITRLLFNIPKLDPVQTENLIDSSYKDLIMISYLTNLIKNHVKILNLYN